MSVFWVSIAEKKYDFFSRRNRLNSLGCLLNFQYTESFEVSLPDENVSLFCFSRNDALYSSADYFFSRKENEKVKSFTVFQGYIWLKDKLDAKPLTAANINEFLCSNDPEALRGICNGEYSIVHYEDGKGLFAFNDRLSVEKIYFHRSHDGFIIISNRIRLIKSDLQEASYDLESLGYIPLCGYMVGEKTSIKDIHRVPQGGSLIFHKDRFRVLRNDLFFFDPSTQKDIKGNFNSFFEKALDECTSNITACLKENKPFPIPLSGGKDSRAVLALMLRSGLKNINAYTHGFDRHPDVRIAIAIANHYDLNHNVNITDPESVAPSGTLVRDIVLRLMGHVFQTDGMLTAWDLKGYSYPKSSVAFAGHIGEVYRGNYHRSEVLANTADVFKIFKQTGLFDPANLMTNDAKNFYKKDLKERADFYLDNGADFEDLPDIFYTVERVPNWVGALRRHDGYSNKIVNPLNTESLIKLAFYLGRKQRLIERIHFEMINRSDSWLSFESFANDQWHVDLYQYLEEHESCRFGKPVKTPEGLPTFGSWQQIINQSNELKLFFLELLHTYDNSEVWNFFDRQSVIKIFFRKNLSYVELLSLYGFIGLFFLINNIELPMKLLARPEEVYFNKVLGFPVKSDSSNAVYIYDGVKNFNKMNSWEEFELTGVYTRNILVFPDLVINKLCQ